MQAQINCFKNIGEDPQVEDTNIRFPDLIHLYWITWRFYKSLLINILEQNITKKLANY